MQWLSDNWFVLSVGVGAACFLLGSVRRHRGCCGDTTLAESKHDLR